MDDIWRTSTPSSLSFDIFDQFDIAYEKELQRHPYEQKIWWKYIQSKDKSPPSAKFIIYERALKKLPGSYKIWWNYLQDRVSTSLKSDIDSSKEEVNDIFERSLLHTSRMPRIWLDYCKYLEEQRCVTRTRRTYDRALKTLPITQHNLIWKRYLEFVGNANVLKTSLCVYRRYLLVEPNCVEDLIQLMSRDEAELWDEAAALMAKIVNDEGFFSTKGKTNHQLWMELCDLITKHPASIRSLKVEPVLRAGIRKFTDEVGRLWCSLADHFIRLGLLEKARDIYEEGMNTVLNLHDFAMIFDAYTAFEESIVTNFLEANNEDEDEIGLHFARLENLMDRRPELVSAVKLRQNPHNVHEWLNRSHLFKDDPVKVIRTFGEAVKTIDPDKVVGRLSTLWTKFAKFYELHDDVENAEAIFLKSTAVQFKTVDELATMWCEWMEFELRHQRYSKALEIARQSVSRLAPKSSKSSHQGLHKSVKLWSLVMDLEESLGTFESMRICFDKMYSLKVLTPQIIINYAHYLEEEKYFEESFKVYEKGVAAFRWPHLNDLWLMYLTKFVGRYGNKKIARARELFDEAIHNIPEAFAKRFYLLYAKLEEEFGLAKHALTIYSEATKHVKTEEKLEIYNVYIAKTVELFGVAKARRIYEEAIEVLPDDQVRHISLQYAAVEKGLGEIDRARTIYQHASQFCDPNREPEFWKIWREFEVVHGNEDTFRDMLRMKRSVLAQYSQIHFNAAELIAESSTANPMEEAEQLLAVQQENEKKRVKMENEFDESKELAEKRNRQEEEDLYEAEREYKQLKLSRASAAPSSHNFIASPTFSGYRLGYVFKTDTKGTGYYIEKTEPSTEEVDIDIDSIQQEIHASST